MKLTLDDIWSRPRPLPIVADPAPDADVVRGALARIVAHPVFAKSIKLQRFLTYVVEETIAGRAARLKAYNIATIALGRPESFDPSQDPIVRVEASRLRRALSAYYASDGVQDPVKIMMNAGSYQPVFSAGTVDEMEPAALENGRGVLLKSMSPRERLLFGLVVLLFLITFSNTVMLTLSVSKLDDLERAMGLTPSTVSYFSVP